LHTEKKIALARIFQTWWNF